MPKAGPGREARLEKKKMMAQKRREREISPGTAINFSTFALKYTYTINPFYMYMYNVCPILSFVTIMLLYMPIKIPSRDDRVNTDGTNVRLC